MSQDSRTGIYHTFPSGVTREVRVELLDEEMVEVYRRMSGAERLRLASERTLQFRERIRQAVVAEQSDLSPEEVRREVARRFADGALG